MKPCPCSNCLHCSIEQALLVTAANHLFWAPSALRHAGLERSGSELKAWAHDEAGGSGLGPMWAKGVSGKMMEHIERVPVRDIKCKVEKKHSWPRDMVHLHKTLSLALLNWLPKKINGCGPNGL